jgi:hypothetical protein
MITTPSDIAVAMGTIATAVSAGELTPEEGAAVAAVLETQRRAIETMDLKQRVAALKTQRAAT